MTENNLPSEIYSEKAAQLRSQRIADLTRILLASEGQPLYPVLLRYSKAASRSMKTVNEYWEVISEDNLGPIYERNSVIKVRRAKRKRFLVK